MKSTVPLSEEDRNAFTVAYRFYERFHNMENTDDDWMALVDEVVHMPEPTRENELLQGLISFLICYLSDKAKRREDEERNQPEQTVMTIDGRAVNR